MRWSPSQSQSHRDSHRRPRYQRGFSLVEIAIVLMVIGALLGGLIVPLATQQDASKRRETRILLDDVHAALLGFAAANGRLPCPATNASAGRAAPEGATLACNSYHGFVPARTLGIEGPTDDNNRLVDKWLRPVRYSLSNGDGNSYSQRIPLNLNPTFRICPDSACATPIAENVVAVIFSQAADINASADQNENTNGDVDFVTRSLTEAAGSEFDDEIRWLSPNTLVFNLVRSGQLN